MAKILRNDTGGNIAISDTGITIQPGVGNQYTIPSTDDNLWAASSDIITEVGAGNIVVTDGTIDLDISDGIDLIKGLNPRDVSDLNGLISTIVDGNGKVRFAVDVLNATDPNLITGTVTASSAFDIDTIPLASLCVVKYTICMFSSAQDKWRSLELLGGKITSSSVEDSVYSIIGSSMDIDVDFTVSAGNAKLTITNNEVFDIDVKIYKKLI